MTAVRSRPCSPPRSSQLPEDVGKAPPIGLLLIVVLLIAVALLVRSMTTHLKRIPPSFEPQDDVVQVPDDAVRARRPGPAARARSCWTRCAGAPRAIEPPRSDDDGRPDAPGRADRPAVAGCALPAVGDVDHQPRGVVRSSASPSSVNTRNGSRARTPRARVVWPSKLPAHAT